jgi:hypothetical protein
VEALAAAIPLFLLLFALVYFKMADLLVVGLVLRVTLGAVKAGRERRDAASADFAESSNRGDAGQIPSPYVPEQGSGP